MSLFTGVEGLGKCTNHQRFIGQSGFGTSVGGSVGQACPIIARIASWLCRWLVFNGFEAMRERLPVDLSEELGNLRSDAEQPVHDSVFEYDLNLCGFRFERSQWFVEASVAMKPIAVDPARSVAYSCVSFVMVISPWYA